jgi:hypothetical protein
MDKAEDTAVDDLILQPAPGKGAAPEGELTDEDLEVVVGGLGRPWIALEASAK